MTASRLVRAAAASFLCLWGSSAAGQQTVSVLDGVYTMEQVRRGQLVTAEVCARCHGGDLTGGEIGPRIVGRSWWQSVNMTSLYRFVSEFMPANDPGGLTRQQYVDAIAFMLWATGYPAGDRELTPNLDQLNTVRVELLP